MITMIESIQNTEDWQNVGQDDLLQYWKDVYGPLQDYHKTNDYLSKLKILREFYRTNEQRIFSRPDKFFMSYPVDWMSLFTPIERLAWNSIRCKRGVVLYPQYPVLKYFVDFGNPVKRVALELDGKHFHNTDRDRIRDRELRAAGWKVYRVTGKDMYRNDFMDYYDCSRGCLDDNETYTEIENWIMNTGDGVIEAIAVVHFRDGEAHENEYMFDLCQDSLKAHQLK